jgi:hypothetical protein
MDKPPTYRIRKSTKVLLALASGLIVLMLGTMTILSGLWGDNFQRMSQSILRLTQSPARSVGLSNQEFEEQATSPLARKGLNPQETGQGQPQGREKSATPAPKPKADLGQTGKISSPGRGVRNATQTPAASLRSSGSGPRASRPLPPGFGHMEFAEETSVKVEKQLSEPPPAPSEIKPEPSKEAKPSTQGTSEPQAALSPVQPSPTAPSSPPPPAPAQVASGSQLVVHAGQSLTGIANRNYPQNRKIGLLAVFLANPAIAYEDTIYPGQKLYLPEVNFANQTIRLHNHLLYGFYGTYRSAASLKEDTAWLAKKKVHFVVRNTKDSRGTAVHRVFLGGYATDKELEKAFGDVKTQTR